MTDTTQSPQGFELHPSIYAKLIETAFAEDLGMVGDLTTDAIVDKSLQSSLVLRSRQAGVVAGVGVAEQAFKFLDDGLVFQALIGDGSPVEPGDELGVISGCARSILTAERTVLNLLSHMSGIATQTALLVDAISSTAAEVVCTRKTTPGLRAIEKYSVRVGGGANHRFGLNDAIMIKDNHIAVAGGVRAAVELARSRAGHLVKIEVEVDTLAQLDELIDVGADVVLLDNMDPDTLRLAVAAVSGNMTTEASGGITLQSARHKAEAGVDLLSVGWLTHSAPILDIGLDYR